MSDKIRILYIDDYELDRELVKDALEKEHGGFEVLEASDKGEFENLLKTHRFEVVLSDFNIAGFEGLQVLEAVRRHDPRIPVIIVTGTGSEEIAVKALKLGASDYVIKRPQHIRKLPQTIFAAIEKKALRDQRQSAEAALKQSEQRYRKILENVLVGVYQVALDGKFIFANQKMVEMFGFSSYEELKAIDSIARLYARPQERTRAIDDITRDGFFVGEREFKRKDGHHIWIRLNIRKTTTKEGGVILEGLMEDVTQIRTMEAQLQQAQRLEAIGTLAGGIAHDFNNILASIIGFTELSLGDVEKGSDIEDNLHEIYTAGKRAKDLIKQILVFARQSGEQLIPVRVDSIIKEVLKLIRPSIPTTIRNQTKIESDSLILGNPTQVHQILMNLCTNAAKAMEDKGGILDVGVKDVTIENDSNMHKAGLKPGNYIELKVTDTGVGIPPDIIDSVFEPYFTTRATGEGSGMGLAVSQGIVASYGGKIIVESKAGKGAIFTTYLPVTQKPKLQRSSATDALPRGKERILFVDDEDSIVKMSRRLLEQLGYSVTTMTGSVAALELFRSKPADFDIVISDMTMPDMTGDKLAIELIKIRPNIPIILCTGFSKKMSEKKAAEIGIKAFAHKPVVKADLAQTVRKVLDDA
jgi:PAS domain S-box-containing protein